LNKTSLPSQKKAQIIKVVKHSLETKGFFKKPLTIKNIALLKEN